MKFLPELIKNAHRTCEGFPSFIRTIPSVAGFYRSHSAKWQIVDYLTTDWDFPPAGGSPCPEGNYGYILTDEKTNCQRNNVPEPHSRINLNFKSPTI